MAACRKLAATRPHFEVTEGSPVSWETLDMEELTGPKDMSAHDQSKEWTLEELTSGSHEGAQEPEDSIIIRLASRYQE
jgi:hypothetical protein